MNGKKIKRVIVSSDVPLELARMLDKRAAANDRRRAREIEVILRNALLPANLTAEQPCAEASK